MSYEIPEPSLTPEEPKVALYCDCCGGEIYEGKEYYRIEPLDPSLHSLNICKDCMKAAREEA